MSRKKSEANGRSGSHFEESVERLFCLDLLNGLAPEEQRAALDQMEFQTLGPGEVLVNEGDAGRHLFFLADGELAVRSQGHLMGLVQAPHTLGLVALLDDEGRSATLEAFEPCEIFTMSEAAFDHLFQRSERFARNVATYLAGELRDAYGRERAFHQNLEDFFLSPNARLVPGPYRAMPFDMLLFLMKWDCDKLRALLPPGLTPIPGLAGIYLLTFSFFPGVCTENPSGMGKSFQYNETVPFLPALGPGLRPGAFCPELYPDNMLAILLGRELYGFPKRHGSTLRHDNCVDFVMADRMVARASFADRRSVSPAEFASTLASRAFSDIAIPDALQRVSGAAYEYLFQPGAVLSLPFVRLFLHKQIPDVTSVHESVFQVDELVELPFMIQSIGSYKLLKDPRVQFFAPDFFLGGEAVAAFSLRMSFEFGAGKHLIDYRGEGNDGSGGLGSWLNGLKRRHSKR